MCIDEQPYTNVECEVHLNCWTCSEVCKWHNFTWYIC